MPPLARTVLAAALVLAGLEARAQAACPAGHPEARALVEDFVSHPDFAAELERAGVEQAPASSVRILDGAASERDRALCARYAEHPNDGGAFRAPEWVRIYYRTDANVYAAYIRPVEVPNAIYGLPLVVMDAEGETATASFLVK